MSEQKKPKLFINRELSWLEFNRRVLDLSRDKLVPIGEQLNFAAIYGSNLDEFFMVRVGSLCDQTLLKSELKENKTNMTATQQLAAIMPKVVEIQKSCDKDIAKLYEKLASYKITKIDFTSMAKSKLVFWKKYFLQELYPVLSPQIVDRRHPFPFLRDREIYIGALLKDGKNSNPLLGLIPVSTQFERLLTVVDEEETHFALVEELILQFAEIAFGKSNVQAKCIFRITRNADINVEEGMLDHDIDYRVVMSELLKKRRKLAAVRLQIFGEPPADIINFLQQKLMLPADHCMTQRAPLELSFLRKLASRLNKLEDPQLFFPVKRPIQPPAGMDLYQEVRHRDMLLCYPHQSMRPFLQMLRQAGNDPDVVSIKMTLYRVADDSQVIEALVAAAENGKEVVTIVELRARFDEQNNIDWSRQLEQAGCTVIYGFSEYKVHSKLTLITRRKGKKYEYISQIGTGNYNEKTSELYTDLAYITSNTEIGEEVATVFNNLAVEQLTQNVSRLIVAPLCFKSVLLAEMQQEQEYQLAGGQGQILIKCNSISDKKIIETLSAASAAGVSIDMIVRGICCLQAGLPGLSENIRVRSLVGRYLEHSRIYAFGSGERLRVYIASGDFLTRNTERRVEVGVRIDDPDSKAMLCDILAMQMNDNVNAREMQPDGLYAKVERPKNAALVDSQLDMYGYLEERMARLGFVDTSLQLGSEQLSEPVENKELSSQDAVVPQRAHRKRISQGPRARRIGRITRLYKK